MTVAIRVDDSGTPAADIADPAPDRAGRRCWTAAPGDAYRAGEYGQALRLLGLARAADPSRAPRLDEHRARASAAQAGRRALPAARSPRSWRPAWPTPGSRRMTRRCAGSPSTTHGRRPGRGRAEPAPASGPERERFRQQVLDAAAELEAGS